MPSDRSLGAAYFEGMFRGDADPWGLESRPYEAAKHDATVAALGEARIPTALEIGCAGGALTTKLATRCDDLLAVDISQTALDRAVRRCRDQPQVRFQCLAFPSERPAGPFDLLVLSEVAYYWSDADLKRTAHWIASGGVVPGGRILLVHYTGQTDYPQTGDGAVARLRSGLGDRASVLRENRADRYRVDLWNIA